MLVCKAPSKIRLHQHICVIKVQSTINNFSSVLNFKFVLLVLAVAESDVVEYSCL